MKKKPTVLQTTLTSGVVLTLTLSQFPWIVIKFRFGIRFDVLIEADSRPC